MLGQIEFDLPSRVVEPDNQHSLPAIRLAIQMLRGVEDLTPELRLSRIVGHLRRVAQTGGDDHVVRLEDLTSTPLAFRHEATARPAGAAPTTRVFKFTKSPTLATVWVAEPIQDSVDKCRWGY
jgi:hypothetical protein